MSTPRTPELPTGLPDPTDPDPTMPPEADAAIAPMTHEVDPGDMADPMAR